MKRLMVLVLATGLLSFGHVLAFNPQPDPPGFGMFGITKGQTLRLNVSDVPAASPQTPPDPCRVELTFTDSKGNLLLPAVQKVIQPGASAHIDLDGDAFFLASPAAEAILPVTARAQVRPVIRFLPSSTRALAAFPPGPCVSTIEIIDNETGKTLVTSGPQNPGSLAGFNPQPEPPKTFGIVGIIRGQTARVNVVNASGDDRSSPPDPCRVTIAFLDEDGEVVLRSSQVLKAGEAAFLDASSEPPTDSAVDAAPANQMALRAVVKVESIGSGQLPPDPCHATLEVFDNGTGKTTTVLSPQHPNFSR